MADQTSKTTNEINEIKEWVEKRDGKPAVVTKNGEKTELLRIMFNNNDKTLKEISWEDFEKIFNKNNLSFLYQEQMVDGEESRFFKFVNREPS